MMHPANYDVQASMHLLYKSQVITQVIDTAMQQEKHSFEDLHHKTFEDTALDTGSSHLEELHGTLDEVLTGLAARHNVNQKRLMLKLDLLIIPPICILYILAFLDRVNISNAAVYGMSADLGIPAGSIKYNTAICIFFVPYVLFEVASNYFLKKFKPSVWLPLCMVLFGAMSLALGFIKNYGQLLGLRFLLGLFESGMFPGCFYLLSCWYRREEAQKRFTFFFSSTSLAGAFGGLIAYGMDSIDGKKGISSWRWLFIVEGAITVFVALVMFFLIADFPEQAKFLKANERAFIKEKLAYNAGESHMEDDIKIIDVLKCFKEWKIICSGLMYFGCIVPAYGYAYFAPTIIKGFGYSTVKTQIYSIFPWITTFGGGMIFAIFSDLTKHRYAFTLIGGCLAVVGFGLLLGLDAVPSTVHARYAACFLICMGSYGIMPILVCWTTMNFSGHVRKMVGSAFQIAFGNIGGIVSAFIYRSADAKKSPQYALGNGVACAMAVFTMIVSLSYLLGIMYENKIRAQGKCDAKWAAMSERERALAGDLNPKFRYQY